MRILGGIILGLIALTAGSCTIAAMGLKDGGVMALVFGAITVGSALWAYHLLSGESRSGDRRGQRSERDVATHLQRTIRDHVREMEREEARRGRDHTDGDGKA